MSCLRHVRLLVLLWLWHLSRLAFTGAKEKPEGTCRFRGPETRWLELEPVNSGVARLSMVFDQEGVMSL